MKKSLSRENLGLGEQKLEVWVEVVLKLTIVGGLVVILDGCPVRFEKFNHVIFDWLA